MEKQHTPPSASASTSTPTPPANDAPPHYFLISVSELASKFLSHLDHGHKSTAITALQLRDGPNALQGGGGVSWASILAAQIFNAMSLVLILAFAVSAGIQSWVEAGVIAAVIIVNVGVGFVQ
jgi:Na+-exporting ATPase